ncbi:MAG: DNA translocase FtsK, partial [Solirubrobacteraceae bacterium]
MAARKRSKTPPKRATRSLLAARPSLHLPRPAPLEPHHVDIAALGLIALGILLGGVAYAGWDGGALGNGAVTGLRFLLGALGYVVPAALLLGGALVLAREVRPPVRPLRTGLLCLTASITLALAAGTLGVGPGAAPAGELWRAASFENRGGILGQALLWVTSHLISTVGADILAVFLFVAGLILVTGAGVAGVVRTTRAGVAGTTRVIRRSTEGMSASATRRPATAAARMRSAEAFDEEPAELLLPPEPDTSELVVRATHVEAPPISALFGGSEPDELERESEDPDPEPSDARSSSDEPERADPDPDDLTPQGRYRGSVTDDPSFVWRIPPSRFLVRATGEAAKPDTAGQEQVAATLVETLGHFGIEAKVIGRVTGPHITRYELRLAPGTKVSKVAQLKDDLAYALAATEIRILAPIPGKQAVGVEVPNARRRIVHLGDVFQDPPPDWSPLTVWLGKDIAGRAIGADLAKMPHLLVAGTTGAGKSACVNAML